MLMFFHKPASGRWIMRTSRIVLLGGSLLLLLVGMGCSDDTATVDETDYISPFYGTWRVTSGGEELRYLIFRAQNSWVVLGEDDYGYRGTDEGTYVADAVFISFGGSRFQYALLSHQLALVNSTDTVALVLDPNGPSESTWVGQLTAVDSITAPVNQPGDIAADSIYLWTGSGVSPLPSIYRIDIRTRDTTVIGAGTQPVAVEYDGTNLWTTGYFSNGISKLNPATGEVLSTSIPIASSIVGLAWNGSQIWCSSSVTKRTYVYNPATNAVDATFSNIYGEGMTFAGGNLFMCKNGLLHRCVTSTMRAAASYQLAQGPMEGVAWDGTDLWVLAATGQSPAYVHKLFKVRLPS
jgi:hypothetical protein